MDPFKPYEPRPRAKAPPKLSEADAETLALQALAFIAGDDALMSGFVALTGCGPDELRGRLAERGFLVAVLDFLLSDEAATIRFAEDNALAPETPMLARMKLDPPC